jgi:integrase
VDKNFCIGFREYLLQKVSQNTAHTYFARLKAVLNQAVEREVINTNPSRFSQIKKTDVYKEFLTVDDLRKLKETPCYNQETKNAFLFSCYTGLRFSDIDSLRFKDIEGGYINFKQQKTKGYERIKLSKNAIAIINSQRERGKKEGKVFNLLYPTTTIVHIQKWVRDAGIKKHITWHSGRHTFATLALTHDIDLYTVSKLLGHKEIKTTQIYAKLIDKKKDEAVDKLPVI